MYIKVKYIRTKNNAIIIFPETIQHSDFRSFEPISAGFCGIDFRENKIRCYGESISLKLKSRPKEDSYLATEQLVNQNFIFNTFRMDKND